MNYFQRTSSIQKTIILEATFHSYTQTNTFTNQENTQQHKHKRTSLTQMKNNTEEKKVNGTFRLNDEATSQKRGKHKSIIISFTKSETKKLKGLKNQVCKRQ